MGFREGFGLQGQGFGALGAGLGRGCLKTKSPNQKKTQELGHPFFLVRARTREKNINWTHWIMQALTLMINGELEGIMFAFTVQEYLMIWIIFGLRLQLLTVSIICNVSRPSGLPQAFFDWRLEVRCLPFRPDP